MAAIYSTRELAMPGPLFRLLSDLNFMGGSIFAGTMVALLLCYPRRVGPSWLGAVAVLSQLVWFAAQQVDVFDSMILARRVLVMAAVAATFGLSWWQWRMTREDPVGRAALRWFLLSWVVVSGVFALLILLPQMFGFDTTGVQAYSFLMFVLVYVGLGFGILRYRLFGLDEWWAKIITWMAAVALLVVLDLLFLLQMHLSSGMSLSLSLLICGLLWLPLRGFLTEHLLGRAGGDNRNAFKAVVDVALAPHAEDHEALWRQCLRGRFNPLRIESVESAGQEPELDELGRFLLMPAVGKLGALRLDYARGGRALFTKRDLEAARELMGMLRHVIDSRQAYEKGVRVERVRIARDIHDNIGAQLLSALHSREEGRRDEVLRGALADLRGIINDASNPELAVEEALGDLRYETSGRLAAAGLELEWRVADGMDGAGMSPRLLNALRALVREAASNILKHARAKKVRVMISKGADEWVVVIEDDGAGFDPAAVRRGNGLTNMESRVAELGGRVEWQAGEGGGGARVVFRLPVQTAKQL
jgi:signal transduction histidine kinase